MKKNEYMAPEMEIVEITNQCSILDTSDPESGGKGKFPPGWPGTSQSRSVSDDED